MLAHIIGKNCYIILIKNCSLFAGNKKQFFNPFSCTIKVMKVN